MKNIKTFEAYFNLLDSRPSTEEEIFSLIGVNSEIIQDFLVEIEDKLKDVHMSVDFMALDNNNNNQHNYYITGVEYKSGKPFNKYINKEIKKVSLYIAIFPGPDRLKYLSNKYKDKEIDKSWHDIILDGEDITDEINTLENRLKEIGFYDIKVSEEFINTPDEKIDYRYFSEPQFVPTTLSSKYYPIGHKFLSIRAKKDVIKK